MSSSLKLVAVSALALLLLSLSTSSLLSSTSSQSSSFLAVNALPAPAPAPAPFGSVWNLNNITQWASQFQRVKGKRYCEVLAVSLTGLSTLQATVYTTFGLNDCPQAAWAAINGDVVKSALGGSVIGSQLNGPRYWTMDYFLPGTQGADPNAPPTTIGSLQFRVGGIVNLTPAQLQLIVKSNSQPYTPAIVNRTVDWLWLYGSTAFVVTDAWGNEFVMQSYSQIVNPTLSLSDLKTLQLSTLPAGWTYEARRLKSNIVVASGANLRNNYGLVVQDDYLNSYSCIEYDLDRVVAQYAAAAAGGNSGSSSSSSSSATSTPGPTDSGATGTETGATDTTGSATPTST